MENQQDAQLIVFITLFLLVYVLELTLRHLNSHLCLMFSIKTRPECRSVVDTLRLKKISLCSTIIIIILELLFRLNYLVYLPSCSTHFTTAIAFAFPTIFKCTSTNHVTLG